MLQLTTIMHFTKKLYEIHNGGLLLWLESIRTDFYLACSWIRHISNLKREIYCDFHTNYHYADNEILIFEFFCRHSLPYYKVCIIKFIYFKKVTKFENIFTLLLVFLSNIKNKEKISFNICGLLSKLEPYNFEIN